MGGLKEASRIWSLVSATDGDAGCFELRVCKIWKDEVEEEEKACKAARKVEREGMEKPWELIGAGAESEPVSSVRRDRWDSLQSGYVTSSSVIAYRL